MSPPTLLLPRVAAKLEEHGEAELAADVRALHGGETVDGHTQHNIALARHWHILSAEGPAKIIHAAGPLLVLRLSIYFGAIPKLGTAKPREFTFETHRALKTTQARRALACFGEIDWSKATRDVRAAFLYGQLIRRGVR